MARGNEKVDKELSNAQTWVGTTVDSSAVVQGSVHLLHVRTLG
jgi:hypothetical protein